MSRIIRGMTSMDDGHFHHFEVTDSGTGLTDPSIPAVREIVRDDIPLEVGVLESNVPGHSHAIVEWKMQRVEKHIHKTISKK